MSGSEIFNRLRKYFHVALHCERTGQPAREALEELDYAQNQARERRRLLAAIGAGAAVGAFPSSMRSALAAPSVSGGVAIVGAGLAGLSCAYTLAGKGVRASVFEASERAGGRCFSLYNFFPGQVAERGGEFIDTGHVTMRGFANAFGLSLEAVSKMPGEVFYFIDGQHYDEAQVVEEFRAFVPALREDLQKLTPPTADNFTEDDRILDFTNMKDYLATRGAGPLIGKVLDVAYNIEYGREIEEQSCLNLLLFIHADRRSKFRPFGVFSDERFHVVEGNDGITTGLANSLPQGVTFGHRLLRARKLSDGRVQLAFNVGGKTVETEHEAVVFAIPFSVLREVELDASLGLPDWKRFAIDNFQYGTNSKMMIGFNGRPWLDLYGSNGTSYSTGLPNHQNTWETNPIRATGSNAILTDYSGGKRGERLDPNKVQTEASRFLADLENIYPGAGSFVTRNARGRILVHLENWSKNPLVKGSYTCNAPGYFTTIAGNEQKPVGNLFFAGEHTDSFYSWQGFMEGACLSGLTAATESFNFLRGK
jgi:monoamine oxidase